MTTTSAERRAQDVLANDWLERSGAADHATLHAVERAHWVAVPGTILIGVGTGSPTMLVTGAAYVLGVLLAFRLARPGRRLPWLAVLDLLVIFAGVLVDHRLWVPMTISAGAATSIGWMLSTRHALVLAGLSTVGVAVTGAVSGADAVVPTTLVYLLVNGALAVTNGTVYTQRTAGARRIAQLLESVPVMLWEVDLTDGRITHVAGRIDRILGMDAEEWASRSAIDLIHPDDVENMTIDWSARIGGEPVEHEIRALSGSGDWVPLRQIVGAVEVGGRTFLRGVSLDITAERRAREAVEQYAAIVEHMADGLIVLRHEDSDDPCLRLHRWNRAMTGMVGLTELHRGRRLREVFPAIAEDLRRQMEEAPTEERDHLAGSEIPVRGPEGGTLWIDYHLFRIGDGARALRVSDVSSRKRAQDELRSQATHDQLTGLFNRVAFVERLELALASEERLGILLLDLDAFKEINDTLGHHYGDRVLAILARRFMHLPDMELVARLGGDEFAFLVRDVRDLTAIEQVADRVAGVVEETIRVDDLSLRVGPSIGIALAPEHGRASDVLLQRADIAMYQAKRLGRRHQAYRPAEDHHDVVRLALMGELDGMFDRDEIRMWFQPKVDLFTGRVTGVEALMRWQHPREGLLTPDRFIELLEISGQLNEATWVAIDRSLTTIAAIAPELSVAVNVPARTLLEHDVAQRILDRLALAGLPPTQLHLELTEREIMEDNTMVRSSLADLCTAGVRISIDDFGTGYSSLSYLRRLPVSEIKIDQTFVAGMLPNDHDYLIARAITDLGHNLGHRIVAEGVEDEATLELLRGIGCDEAQGYLFSPPVPAEQLVGVVQDIERRRLGAHRLPRRVT